MALVVQKVEFDSADHPEHPQFGQFHFVFSAPSTRLVQATFYASQHTKGAGLGDAENGARGNILGYLKDLVAQLEEEAAAKKP